MKKKMYFAGAVLCSALMLVSGFKLVDRKSVV